MQTTLTQLFIYPVKSLAGIALNQAQATPSGLAGDRQWAVAKADGSLLTQRKEPAMATIKVSLTASGLVLHHSATGSITVHNPAERSAPQWLQVWKDRVPAQIADAQVNHWISETLKSKQALRLLRVHPQAQREFHTPQRFGHAGAVSYFSDAAPYLVVNQASLDALNDALARQGSEPVDIRHFRANMVIAGMPAFTEHRVEQMTVGSAGAALRLVDPCQRCVMITVDPDRGRFLPGARPFRTLTALNAMPKQPKAPAFGVNATLTSSPDARHLLCVGDRISFS